MFRPSAGRPSSNQRAIARNLSLDIVASIGVGVTAAIITAILPTVARRGGLEPLGLAALAAAPFIANFLGAFAGSLGPRTPSGLAVLRAVGAASLIATFVVPVPLIMIGAALAFWLSLSFGGPFHLRLWGGMYPSRLRGRILGAIGMSRAAAAALAAIAGGLVADRLGGPSAMAIAGLVGLGCAIAYAGLRARAADAPRRFSARESIATLRERPVLARAALAQGFYGGGLIAASPLFALVFVDRLDLSLADVGVIGILTAAATTASFLGWGAVADRRGPMLALRLGSAVGVVALVGFALATRVEVLWLAAIGAGAASASIDVGIASLVSEHTTLDTRAPAMAGWNALTGARGIAAAFLMSGLVQLGLIDVTAGLLLCAAASAVGVALYARAGAPQPTRAPGRAPSAAVRSVAAST